MNIHHGVSNDIEDELSHVSPEQAPESRWGASQSQFSYIYTTNTESDSPFHTRTRFKTPSEFDEDCSNSGDEGSKGQGESNRIRRAGFGKEFLSKTSQVSSFKMIPVPQSENNLPEIILVFRAQHALVKVMARIKSWKMMLMQRAACHLS